jgi:hypothetical protein
MGVGRSSSLSAIVTPHPPRNRAKTVTLPSRPFLVKRLTKWGFRRPRRCRRCSGWTRRRVVRRTIVLNSTRLRSFRRGSTATSVCAARGASWLQPRQHTSARNSMNTILRRQTGECRSADGAVRRPTIQRDCTTFRSKVNWPGPPIGWPPSLDWWTLSVLGSPE